ncbi:MAG: isochorismatase family cysteine hydrolase [Nanoarchaeota archaeon]
MDKYTQPDFFSIALITIDTQRDTLDGQPFEIPGTSAILPKMQQLTRVFRKHGLPIIHIVRLYKKDGSNVDLCRRSLVEKGSALLCPGTAGCELATELLPEPDIKLDTDLLLSGGIQHIGAKEVIIYKPRWGGFYKTPLEKYLCKLGVSSLAFAGCNFPNCPRTSIYEASERDFRIVLVEDAVSGLYEQDKKEMWNIGVWLMNARELAGAVSTIESKG